jgi:hypothetical protein
MKRMKVDWEELELAFREASATENYLDLDTGEILSIVPGLEDEADLRNHVNLHPDKHARILPLTVGQATSILADFALGLSSASLRGRIEEALANVGAYATALAIVREDSRVWNSYARFEQEAFWRHVSLFLHEHGIAAKNPPPEMELFADVA